MTLLGPFCRILDQRRRVPLGEEHWVPFSFQPLIKQGQLGRLTAAVGAFDDKEFARKIVLAIGNHCENLVPLTTCQIKLERRVVKRLRAAAEASWQRSC